MRADTVLSGSGSDTAENLAVFRVVVALLLLGSSDLQVAPQVAALPASLRSPPAGLGVWLMALPLSAPVVRAAVGLVGAAALFGLIGLWARAAFAVATVAGVYGLGVAQLGGAVWHCHHLVWFSALLAASPCSDALSVDAWWAARRRRQGRPRRALCYGLPLRLAWALLGVIFFFPGLWKLRASGLAWIGSDNLRNQMYWKWLQLGGTLPWLRIDRVPLLCRALAAFIVALELTFPLLILFRRSRPVAVGAALLFHLGAWVYMGIDYSILWPCYLVFFDWTPWVVRLRTWAGDGDGDPRRWVPPYSVFPTALVGGMLLLGSAIYGVQGRMNAWPFACYPTFQRLAPPTMPTLLVHEVTAAGRVVELMRPWQLGPRGWALSWSVAGFATANRTPDPARLRAYWKYLRGQDAGAQPVAEVCAVRFYRATLAVRPDAWAAPPQSQTLFYSLSLPCSSGGR